MSGLVSSQCYKGCRDFYPKEQRFLTYIKNKWAEACESFGFEPYDGPVLEHYELYAEKSGEELAGEQLFSFLDRGERKIALRPEMTPTLARMVAGKFHELPKPIRWYSIPNCFRYERPQRGRLREFWQLNVDILGGDSLEADVDIICVVRKIMENFGANPSDYSIKFSHRTLYSKFFESLGLTEDQGVKVAQYIDRKLKMDADKWNAGVTELVGVENAEKIKGFCEMKLHQMKEFSPETVSYCETMIERLNDYGIRLEFDVNTVRGLAYYTGFVFEVYDNHPDNRRAMFGGGRYDNLLGMFGKNQLSGIGFGMGDVTLADFLEVHGLGPSLAPSTKAFFYAFPEVSSKDTAKILRELRENGVNIEKDISGQKLAKVFKYAEDKGIENILILSQEDFQKGIVQVKNLKTKQQTPISIKASELKKVLV